MDPLTLHSRNYLAKVNDSQERNFIRSWMLLQVDQKEEEKVYYICAALLYFGIPRRHISRTIIRQVCRQG